MTEELREQEPVPCPWCGEAVSVSEDTRHRWIIGCQTITCRVGPISEYFPTRAEAVAAWNKQPAQARIAELEAINEDTIRRLKDHQRALTFEHERVEVMAKALEIAVNESNLLTGHAADRTPSEYLDRARRFIQASAVRAALEPRTPEEPK